MCGGKDDNGVVGRRLPAVRALRGGRRRPCDEEEELKVVVVVDDDDNDYDNDEEIKMEEEFRRYCERENKTLPGKAVQSVKDRRDKKGIPDQVVADKQGRAGRPAATARASKHGGFRGVRQRKSGRWAAEIRDAIKLGTRIWIGTYDTPEAAALAYDAAARRIHGRNANTNFPPPEKIKKKKQTVVPAPIVVAKKMKEPAAAEMVIVAPGSGEPAAGEMVAPVLLAHALETSDGWEFEPYSMGLLGGVKLLDSIYADVPDELQLLESGATTNADDGGCLWSF